ncbi:uncharacterized protein BDR25DRAFT_29746 [Lindgomyces ingoldianus]|uniref:Uncharacterized protein n=1 Tax=Lindgomyces ingoldianus TaxID=673940 RepID=A0ACB6QVK8_9PLEO|nr:uncharacterized protein BDR25DRAFT_29746 [Lindgomyces ingoldianus]KAF2471033.1 hypothetical protein BDR25DRAFT_29746 [Lindgomyces ingoldianus]
MMISGVAGPVSASLQCSAAQFDLTLSGLLHHLRLNLALSLHNVNHNAQYSQSVSFGIASSCFAIGNLYSAPLRWSRDICAPFKPPARFH